jgi:hypothetical protein
MSLYNLFYNLPEFQFCLFFFACAKKNQKSTPENDDSPFSGLFLDLTFVLL